MINEAGPGRPWDPAAETHCTCWKCLRSDVFLAPGPIWCSGGGWAPAGSSAAPWYGEKWARWRPCCRRRGEWWRQQISWWVSKNLRTLASQLQCNGSKPKKELIFIPFTLYSTTTLILRLAFFILIRGRDSHMSHYTTNIPYIFYLYPIPIHNNINIITKPGQDFCPILLFLCTSF